MKKFLQILVLISFFSLILSTYVRADFTDVTKNHPNFDAIQYVQQQDIVKGYDDGNFRPENPINRAEFTKIIVESLYPNANAGSGECFSDVPTSQWFHKYACVAKSNGILAGYPDGTFGPGNNILFVEAAKILSNSFTPPADPEDSVWYRPFIKELGDAKAIPTSIVRIDKAITRGEMAEMIYRLKAGIKNKDSQNYESLRGESDLNSHSSMSDDPCELAQKAFGLYEDLVTVSCDDEYIYVTTLTGLPSESPENPLDKIMVGITSWILRLPVPVRYDWKIPTHPKWLTGDFEEASPKGPIAIATNGVPIFHLERRPDVSTHPNLYSVHNDTAQQGELDHCGGHAGQGEDYHYHYVPVCLIENHDLSLPIAYSLDGIPIYFGTGGTNYYGSGRFNDINNLPEGDLDECNALELEDGEYVYYTTKEPPYVIGCHRAHADPKLRIEPRPFRDQGEPGSYGGRVGEPLPTDVLDYYVDEEGWRHLEHSAIDGSGRSATLFRESTLNPNCWDFEFRVDSQKAGSKETHCR